MTDNDFVKLGNGLADSLLAAAEEQVTKAHTILDQTKALVEIIRNQVTAQSKQIEDTNARFRSFGEIMLNAHRVLIGDEPADTREAPVSNLARRSAAISALAAIKPASSSAADANSELGASHPAGHRQLPRAVAGVSQHDPRNDHGENRADPPNADRAYWGADRN